MDRTTEPVIAVLGHPIAGNSAQFALLRVFEAMRVDWRVLSFDVLPAQLHTALDGLDALGFEGVLIATSLSTAASRWASITSTNEAADGADRPEEPFDCLYRARRQSDVPDRGSWRRQNAAAAWLDETVQSHFAARGRPLQRWMLAGDQAALPRAALGRLTTDLERVPFDPEQVDTCDLVIFAPPDSSASKKGFALDRWPRSDASTLVVDLLGVVPPAPVVARGYSLITADEMQVGTLSRCVKTWTGQSPPIDVLREAVEEFTAV